MKYTIHVTWNDGSEETFSDVDGYFLRLPQGSEHAYIVLQWGPQPMTRWKQWSLAECKNMSIEPEAEAERKPQLQ